MHDYLLEYGDLVKDLDLTQNVQWQRVWNPYLGCYSPMWVITAIARFNIGDIKC